VAGDQTRHRFNRYSVLKQRGVLRSSTLQFGFARDCKPLLRPCAMQLNVIAPMIPAAGNGLTGATYQFFDNTLRTGIAAQYYIDDIDIFGKVTRHGPIVVTRIAPTRAATDQRVMPTR